MNQNKKVESTVLSIPVLAGFSTKLEIQLSSDFDSKYTKTTNEIETKFASFRALFGDDRHNEKRASVDFTH